MFTLFWAESPPVRCLQPQYNHLQQPHHSMRARRKSRQGTTLVPPDGGARCRSRPHHLQVCFFCCHIISHAECNKGTPALRLCMHFPFACARRLPHVNEVRQLLKAMCWSLKRVCASCSSLIASCERNGKLDQAVEIVDSMHSAGLYHSPDLYVKLLEALGRQQQWEKALELFLSMQVCASTISGIPAFHDL